MYKNKLYEWIEDLDENSDYVIMKASDLHTKEVFELSFYYSEIKMVSLL